MLRIEHFTKRYGEKVAVDDLSLRIAPGEIFGFIGHNGAGKTTTLKACCGILHFDQGQIFVDGKSSRIPSAANGKWPMCRITRICMNSSPESSI